MPDPAEAAASPPGPADAQITADFAEVREKAKRTKDPVYHVFRVDTKPANIVATLLTEDKPVHAANRREAIAQVAKVPELLDGQEPHEESFLVIRSEELQLITRKVAQQTQLVQTFE